MLDSNFSPAYTRLMKKDRLHKTREPMKKDLLNEFFHEAISRVIPGVVVLVLYADRELVNAFNAFNHSSVIFGLTTLVAAWLIGLTLDSMLYFYFLWCRGIGKKPLAAFKEPTGGTKHLQFMKDEAEKIMCRSMCIVSFFTLFVSPTLFTHVKPELFSEDQWIWQKGIELVAFTLFLSAYIQARYHRNYELVNDSPNAKLADAARATAILGIVFGLVACTFLVVGHHGLFLTPPQPMISVIIVCFVMVVFLSFCLGLCLLTILSGCEKPVVQSELLGSYQADYPFAKETATLSSDGRFTQQVIIKSTSQVLSTNGTWTFDSQDQSITFHDSFFSVLDGFGQPRKQPDATTTRLPVIHNYGEVQIGDYPTTEYKKPRLTRRLSRALLSQ